LGISAGAILRSALIAAHANPSVILGEEFKDSQGSELRSFRLDTEMLKCLDAYSEVGRAETIRRALVAATTHISSNNYRVVWPLEL
jgi:hypothetical protein